MNLIPRGLLTVIFLSFALRIHAAIAFDFERDIYSMSLEELMQISTKVASIFPEKDLMVPASVSQVTAENWRRRGARFMLQDGLDHLPGIVAYPTLGGGTALAIRGYARNVSGGGFSVLVDDVPINDLTFATVYGRSNFNLGLFETMEVSRGPGSSLYGNDAFHGVVALKTFETRHDFTDISGSLGDQRASDLTVRHSQALKNLRFSSAFSVLGQGAQNLKYSSRLFPSPQVRQNQMETGSSLIRIESLPNQKMDWNLSFLSHQFDQDGGLGVGLLMNSLGLGPVDQNEMNTNTRFGLLRAEASWKLSNQRELRFLGYRWSSNVEFIEPVANGLFHMQGDHNERRGFGLRMMQPENGGRTRWVAGVSTDTQKVSDTFTNIPVGPFRQENYEGLERKVSSLYLQTRTRLKGERLYLNLGGRLDHYDVFGNQSAPRVGLIYRPEETVAWKLLWGRAFRVPIATEMTASLGGFIPGDPHIGPEEIDTLELVYLKHFKRSKLSLTYFESSWKDAIVIDRGRFVQSQENEGNGFEIEWAAEINDFWRMNVDYSRATSQNRSTGTQFEAYPKNIVNLGLNFNPRDSKDHYLLSFRYMEDWKDGATILARPLGSYLRTDLSMERKLGEGRSYTLLIRNLFDQNLLHPSIWDSESGVPETARAIRLGFNWRF